MRERAVSSPAFRHPGHGDIAAGGRGLDFEKSRVAFELFCGARPVAQLWGFIHNRRYYAYMSGFDLELSYLSPGRLHLAKTIEHLFGEPVDHIELLTPASPYKMSWTDNVRELVDIDVDIDTLGRFTSKVWHRGLRPTLKSGYYQLPVSLRRYLPI